MAHVVFGRDGEAMKGRVCFSGEVYQKDMSRVSAIACVVGSKSGACMWFPAWPRTALASLQNAAVSGPEEREESSVCVCYELPSVNVRLPLRLRFARSCMRL